MAHASADDARSAQTAWKRARTSVGWLSAACTGFGILNALLTGNLIPAAAILACSFTAFWVARREPNVLILFFAVSPWFCYIFLSLLYSSLWGNFRLDGLFDRDRSFLVVLVYQMGLCSAYVIFTALRKRPVNLGMRLRPTASASVALSLVFLSLSLAASLVSSLPFLHSFSILFFSLHFAFLALVNRRLPWTLRGALIALSTITMIGLATALNARTIIYEGCLFWLIYVTWNARKIVTARSFLAFCGMMVLAAFLNAAFLEVRNSRSKVTHSELISETLAAITSQDVLKAFGFEPGQADGGPPSATRYYSYFLSSGDEYGSISSSLLARLAQIGALDIVVGQTHRPASFDGPRWKAILMAALPDFGQKKDLVLSDELVWDLGLRDKNNVGRPLVSVAGEIYMISGYVGEFLISASLALALMLELHWLQRVVGYGSTYVGVGAMLIYEGTFTGTALSLVALDVRALPIMIALLIALTKALGRREISRENQDTGRASHSKTGISLARLQSGAV